MPTGVISPAHEPKYREYKRLLADRITAADPGSPYSNTTMLELSSHHGFGFAVQAALKHVSTPLVLIVQVLSPCAPASQLPPRLSQHLATAAPACSTTATSTALSTCGRS